MNTPNWESDNALSVLRSLLATLPPPDDDTHSTAEVDGASLPEPFRSLLVHHDHMTSTLKSHYRQDVHLKVLDEHLQQERYARRVVLKLEIDGPAVEFGIVRVDLKQVGPQVRAEILAGTSPLGDILIRHNVMRRVEPRWFLEFRKGSRVLEYFGDPRVEVAYGRLGTIHCNGSPAIELLEVVSGMKAKSEK